MKIGRRIIGPRKPVFIVAEAGINHNGDLQIAKKMIKEASEIGADAIKFQTIFPEELYSPLNNKKLYNLIRKWSFNKKEHLELKNFSEKYNIEFFSTPVGQKSAKLLQDIKINCVKIASGELTNHELITNIAKTKTPMIISTGLSSIDEIESAVNIARNFNCPFVLLHCNASYPTPISEANLSNIPYLADLFHIPVGFSDHTIGNETSLAAVSLGACIIEKHFTLDKNMEGPDQKLSANVNEFRNLVKQIRTLEKSFGKPRTGPTKSEKRFVPLLRKSITAKKNLKRGMKIKKTMLTFLRPGTGIPPYEIDNMIGKTIKKNVKQGTPLRWNMF